MTQTTGERFLNFALYEIGWFACVLGAASGRSASGAIIAVTLVAVHLWLTTLRIAQTKLVAVALLVGLSVDTTLINLGVFRFSDLPGTTILPPFWMSVLWIQFATTLRYCLGWLSERYLLCAILGFTGAPIAFLGGERLGAIVFAEPRLWNLFVLGTVWAVAIPLLVFLSDRLHADDMTAGYRGRRTQ